MDYRYQYTDGRSDELQNIMLVMVNERTHEWVCSARVPIPRAIIRQIMLEALVLTLAGIIGIIGGVTLTGLNSIFTGMDDRSTPIENLMVPLGTSACFPVYHCRDGLL